MSQYILINRILVQNANAVSGFTWGYPAITHFLGFVHNLSRKLTLESNFKDIELRGCAVIAHDHKVHTYVSGNNKLFTQSRNPPYLHSHKKDATPPVIEEGKMNLTVSLLIAFDGNIGNRLENIIIWLKKACFLQRLAGGTILDIFDIQVFNLESVGELNKLKRRILPGFLLMDRSNYLEAHYQHLLQNGMKVELFDAWLDFISLKKNARPESDKISRHLKSIAEKLVDDQNCSQLIKIWESHLKKPYEENKIPVELINYFEKLENNKENKKIIEQWQNYCVPKEDSDADWSYIEKPNLGFLVPIMTGYKAISEVNENSDVENVRDKETPVCFVESVYSVGEWLSVHRIKSLLEIKNCLWFYHYEKNWYLCSQNQKINTNEANINEIIENEFN